MKKIKKSVCRRHAASRRSIQAYWAERARQAREWLALAEEDLASAWSDDVWGNLAQDPPNNYGYEMLIVEAQERCAKADAALRNCLARYEQAVLKGGAR